jgi:Fe-S oxidoreductase
MIEHINHWQIPDTIYWIFYPLLLACGVVLLVRLILVMRLWWKVGRPEKRWDKPLRRIWELIKDGIIQVKMLKQAYPGIMHVAIAWGFFVFFFFGTGLTTIHEDIVPFLVGPLYLGNKLLLDLFTVVAIVGLAMAAYRRWGKKPERLTLTARFGWTLALLLVVVVTGLLLESQRLAALSLDPSLQPGWQASLVWWEPAGWLTAQVWLALGMSVAQIITLHLWLWIFHVVLVGFLLVTLTTSTLRHVLISPLNILLSKQDRPMGKLAPAYQWGEGMAGAATLKDLTWKQLMNGDACTECGRCQDACPAYAAGQPLSPKEVILGIRDALHLQGPQILRGKNGDGGKAPPFTGEVIKDNTLWACTTCGACINECPVMIEHVDAIVDMRRYLLAQQRADEQLMTALMNLRRYGNSLGQSDRKRAMWTREVGFEVKDIRRAPAQTLWYVGDYASYHPALTGITQATARVFQAAGVDFGILYDAERNAGNDVRRVGEEGLFEMLAMKNMAALKKCEYEQIVTTDPHTYNTLKCEYELDGMPVLHYTELLAQLIEEGKLPIKRQLGYVVTYHDPCYLGRYHGVYDAPRKVLQAIGCRVLEMPRHRERALCCGAGGGRIWMEEEEVKERPSESRIREAGALQGIQHFVVSCPKDVTMYRDAIKTVGLEKQFQVKELIELVEEALSD